MVKNTVQGRIFEPKQKETAGGQRKWYEEL
jgi:hypothetical protein